VLLNPFNLLILLSVMIATAVAADERSPSFVKSLCADAAKDSANAEVTTVDIWLSRFRTSFDSCYAKLTPKSEVVIPAHDAPVASKPKRMLNLEPVAKLRPKSKSVKAAAVPAVKAKLRRPIVSPAKNSPIALESLQESSPVLLTKGQSSWKLQCSPMIGTPGRGDTFYISTTGLRTACNTNPK
jgi:hypothetical protein